MLGTQCCLNDALLYYLKKIEGGGCINYIAHSKNEEGKVHDLVDHLTQVAKLTADFTTSFGVADLGYYAGLWHDLGKYNPEFQRYLDNPNIVRGPDHKSAGAVFALNFLEVLAFPIVGHHSGLPSMIYLQQRIKDMSTNTAVKEAITLAKENISTLYPSKKLTPPNYLNNNNYTSLEFFIRMLFSALVDSDFLDTEAHFESDKSILRKTKWQLTTLWDTFKAYHAVISKNTSRLNKLRSEMYYTCLDAAVNKPGIFRLTVPTGGGKTLSGMGFALKHAVQNNQQRVIVAIPYTSIIEQTADVYRKIFGPDVVLEHHSAIKEEPEEDAIHSHHQLAAENWDAPIIVTTTVQLFESIFQHKPSRCRKLHNIANSVIILDEVQTLPVHLMEPILSVLQELADNYQVTVVLCTATQPALSGGPYLTGLRKVQEIIPNAGHYFDALKRVDYQVLPVEETWTWEQVADELLNHKQCLTIVNTKKDAINLLTVLDDPEALHISTLLCGAHRRWVLAEVKKRLATNRTCRLVSTQVIEAGVDIDFPVVLRALGPLDRIVQAAGRCNREGKLKTAEGKSINGKVIIFNPEEGGLPPGVYRAGTDRTSIMLNREDIDLHQPRIYEDYFNSLYQVVDTDANGIQKLRVKLDFPAVADKFQLITGNTVPVVVRYKPCIEAIDRITGEIIARKMVTRAQMRNLQPYLVNIYQDQLPRLMAENYLYELCPGLYQWSGDYDDIYGVREKGRNPEELIF